MRLRKPRTTVVKKIASTTVGHFKSTTTGKYDFQPLPTDTCPRKKVGWPRFRWLATRPMPSIYSPAGKYAVRFKCRCMSPVAAFVRFGRGYRYEAVLDGYFGPVEEVRAPYEDESDSDQCECLAPVPFQGLPGHADRLQGQYKGNGKSKHHGRAELGGKQCAEDQAEGDGSGPRLSSAPIDDLHCGGERD